MVGLAAEGGGVWDFVGLGVVQIQHRALLVDLLEIVFLATMVSIVADRSQDVTVTL